MYPARHTKPFVGETLYFCRSETKFLSYAQPFNSGLAKLSVAFHFQFVPTTLSLAPRTKSAEGVCPRHFLSSLLTCSLKQPSLEPRILWVAPRKVLLAGILSSLVSQPQIVASRAYQLGHGLVKLHGRYDLIYKFARSRYVELVKEELELIF